MDVESLQRAGNLLSIALDILDESEAEVTASLVSSAIDALGFEQFERQCRNRRIALPHRLPLRSMRSCA